MGGTERDRARLGSRFSRSTLDANDQIDPCHSTSSSLILGVEQHALSTGLNIMHADDNDGHHHHHDRHHRHHHDDYDHRHHHDDYDQVKALALPGLLQPA